MSFFGHNITAAQRAEILSELKPDAVVESKVAHDSPSNSAARFVTPPFDRYKKQPPSSRRRLDQYARSSSAVSVLATALLTSPQQDRSTKTPLKSALRVSRSPSSPSINKLLTPQKIEAKESFRGDLFTPVGHSQAQLELLRKTFGTVRRDKKLRESDITPLREITPLRLAINPQANRDAASLAAERAKRKKTWVICHQHPLVSTGIMLRDMLKVGFGKVFLAGKPYSGDKDKAIPWIKNEVIGSNGAMVDFGEIEKPYELEKQTVGDLNRLFLLMKRQIDALDEKDKPEKIIFLSDGGILPDEKVWQQFEGMPFFIVQQTTSGLVRLSKKNPPWCRWIDLSATEPKQIEDLFIGQSNYDRIKAIVERLAPDQKDIGIIGLGRIGINTAKLLIDNGYHVSFYDAVYDPVADEKEVKKQAEEIRNRESEIARLGLTGRLTRYKTNVELLKHNSCIIGCVGADTLRGVTQEEYGAIMKTGNKVLMSVSSGDVEFRSVMINNEDKWINQAEFKQNQLCNLQYDFHDDEAKEDHCLTIAYGDCPITFMNPATGKPDPEPTPKDVIANTRNLLLAGVYYADLLPITEADRHRNVKYATPVPFSKAMSKFLIESFYKSLATTYHPDTEYVRQRAEELGMFTPEIKASIQKNFIASLNATITVRQDAKVQEVPRENYLSKISQELRRRQGKSNASLVTHLKHIQHLLHKSGERREMLDAIQQQLKLQERPVFAKTPLTQKLARFFGSSENAGHIHGVSEAAVLGQSSVVVPKA
jgi:hypothetical protein